MAERPMDLHVSQDGTLDGSRRTVFLSNIDDRDRRDLAIFFDLLDERNLPIPRALDGFVFGIVFYAMRLGQDIRVHGAMSAAALRNLREFQEAWVRWKPSRYNKVEIIPDTVLGDAVFTRKDEAIAAFSGGVDSIFTLLRHATGTLGLGSYPLKHSVLMVHGFDVPLSELKQFDALRERTEPFLRELKVTAKTIRTNLKELALQSWEDSFSSQLACCLHNYAHDFGYALIGSSEPYDALVLPWGSNPATDYLLSGSALRIVHDGAGYSRTQKVETLAQNPLASAAVKVCWEGKETHRNCGICEKCVRTRLNYLAVGIADPACFDTPFDLATVKAINLRNDAQCAELISIATYAKAKGIEAPWLKALEARIRRYQSDARAGRYSLLARKTYRLAREGNWREIRKRIETKFKAAVASSSPQH
ncbi:MAG TPA: hypothetical protein VND94_02945 [Terriglobia bacterium]|nr:hypothetical protein [Terriglobia bacterium]